MQKGCPIDVIDLLREREAEFVRVWRCEQDVRQLLGLEEFPFAPPPDMPSRRKAVKGAGRSAVPRNSAGVGDRAAVGARQYREVRKLQDGENAYRLVFSNGGRTECSFQTDRDLVRNLMSMAAQEFELMEVETVCFRDMENWEKREVVWSRSAMESDRHEDNRN